MPTISQDPQKHLLNLSKLKRKIFEKIQDWQAKIETMIEGSHLAKLELSIGLAIWKIELSVAITFEIPQED